MLAFFTSAPAGGQSATTEQRDAAEQNSDAPPPAVEESEYQRWRQILAYGIESEVTMILSTLERERIQELAPDVRALFRLRFSDALFVAVIRYFERLEDDSIVAEVAAILDDYRQRSEALVLQALHYLRTVPPASLSAAARAHIRALAIVERPTIARAAVDALAAHGAAIDDDDAALIEMLLRGDDTHADVRGGAIIAAGRLGMVDQLADLYRILADEQERSYLRQYAARAIGELAQAASVDTLIDHATHADALLRTAVIEALGSYADDRVTAILQSALRDANDQVRLAAVRAFRTRPLDAAALAIMQYKAIRDPHRVVQIAAIAVLVAEQSGGGAQYLRQQIDDNTIALTVRSEMIAHLVEHAYPDSRAVLLALVRSEQNVGKKSFTLLAIAQRLAATPAPQAAAELYALLLENVDQDTVLYALQGIGFNGLTQTTEAVRHIARNHTQIAVRRQAQLLLDRWTAE